MTPPSSPEKVVGNEELIASLFKKTEWINPGVDGKACYNSHEALKRVFKEALDSKDSEINRIKQHCWNTGGPWMCELHPDKVFPHDNCAGPGMPDHSGQVEINRLKKIAEQCLDDDEENELSMELNRVGKWMKHFLEGGKFPS